MSYDEYAAFGPWVDEVTSLEQVPRLYRNHTIDLDSALLVLKVPRNIARRDADASMHLYDALVIVTAEQLTVLQRRGDGYSEQGVLHRSLYAIEDSVDLLDGRVTLHSADRPPVLLRYNGSSWPVIDRLVILLRRLATRSAPAVVGTPSLAPRATTAEQILVSDRDYGLRGGCAEILRTEDDAVVLGGHATTRVSPTAGLRVLTHLVRPAVLQGAVVLTRPGEISVLHRRSWIARGSDDDLSRARTYVFPRHVHATSTMPHPRYRELVILRIAAGSASLDIVVPAVSATKDFLLTVALAPETAR